MTSSANSSPGKSENSIRNFKGSVKTINPINSLQEFVVSYGLGHPKYFELQGNDSKCSL